MRPCFPWQFWLVTLGSYCLLLGDWIERKALDLISKLWVAIQELKANWRQMGKAREKENTLTSPDIFLLQTAWDPWKTSMFVRIQFNPSAPLLPCQLLELVYLRLNNYIQGPLLTYLPRQVKRDEGPCNWIRLELFWRWILSLQLVLGAWCTFVLPLPLMEPEKEHLYLTPFVP